VASRAPHPSKPLRSATSILSLTSPGRFLIAATDRKTVVIQESAPPSASGIAAISSSGPSTNRELNRVQVVLLTSNVGRLYPSEAYVMLKSEQRKAMADQLSTLLRLP
jgi:hypothetical protein